MSSEGDLTPVPQPDPGQSVPSSVPVAPAAARQAWFAQHRRLLISAGAVIALGFISVAAVLLLVKPPSTVEKMVPATQDAILVANVDPSVTQKVNLMRAVHSFPDTSTDKAIDDKLDEALKDSGLSFTSDIKPWLGSEIGVSAKINLGSTQDSPAAVYIVSRDDTKARAMLAKLRTSKYGQKFQWKDESYSGITISAGRPSETSEKGAAYSLIDHVVVFATSSAQIHEIIDADQGRAPRLVDSGDFNTTVAGLPSDRLGYLYVNGKSVVGDVKMEMAQTPALTVALKNLNDVDALQGIGATLSANGDGLVGDVLVKLDQSRLSPATREALAHGGRADIVVSWIPKTSDAFVAVTSLNRTIQSLADQSGNEASVKTATDAIGLTGAGGVLPHLTGDAGLEVALGPSGVPAGAVLLGTDDARSMQLFFGKLLALADGALSSSFSGSAPGSSFGRSTSPTPARRTHITKSTYRGVVITSWTSPTLGQLGASTFTPSYAVLDGMGILASTPGEAKALIDAHKGGATIASDPAYKTASAASLAKPSAILYADIARLLDAIRKSPFGAQAGLQSGSTLAGEVDPLKAVIITATSDSDKASERVFVIVR